MTRFLSLFALLFLFSTSEASACWPFCLGPASTLQNLPRVNPETEWGVTDLEARTVFETAYGGRKFRNSMEESYQSWLHTVEGAVQLPQRNSYRAWTEQNWYGADELIVEAVLYTVGGMQHPDMGIVQAGTMYLKVSGSGAQRNDTRIAIGVDYDGIEGWLARALVALGGRAQINQVFVTSAGGMSKAKFNAWRQGQSTERDFRSDAALEFALELPETRLISNFLNFQAVDSLVMHDYVRLRYGARANPVTSVMSEFVARGLPPQGPLQAITDAHDQAAPLLQPDPPHLQLAVRPANADSQPPIQSTIGLDKSENSVRGLDEEDELLEQKEDSKQGDKETNPLL
jgi:hypothetical protein